MDVNREKQKYVAAREQREQQSQQSQPPPITNEAKQYIRMRYKQGMEWKAAQRKRNFEDKRTRITEMLLPENRETPIIIRSRDEYIAMDAAYKSLSNKTRTGIDEKTMEDYPETDAEWAALTARLTAAITDLTDILDKPQKNLPDDGNPAVKAVKSLSTLEVQLLAGKLLTATCDAHAGRYNIPSWPKAWKKDWYPSFEERFKEICSALTHSKAIVKGIMDAEFPFAMQFATAPHSEFKVKKGNKVVNDRRAENKKQMKKRLREDDDDLDNDGDADLSKNPGASFLPPRKRARPTQEAAIRVLQRLRSSLDPSPSPSADSSTVSSPNDCASIAIH